jgi:replicative superfamily II helicase
MAFTILTKIEFESILTKSGYKWEPIETSRCKEYSYLLYTPYEGIGIKIFSSVDKATNVSRAKGSDAIRISLWDIPSSRPLKQWVKVLRVHSATTIDERIQERIKTFIKTASEIKLVDWQYVKEIVDDCAKNGSTFANSLKRSLGRWGSVSDRTIPYILGTTTPTNRPTLEAIYRQRKNKTATHTSHSTTATTTTTNHPMKTTYAIPINPDHRTSTKQYKPWKYPFETFNPIQSQTLPYTTLDCNLVIGANTSAGKTVCAELLMDHVLTRKKYNRVIYLSPLKSLTQEKFDDWEKRFPKAKTAILTGDYIISESKQKELSISNIIAMTSEMTDSRTRRMKTEKNEWLLDVGLIVVDETHVLGTDRGHAIESGLMRFSSINPHARIMLLSATMPNCEDLANWLQKLNQKPSYTIQSTWRPVPLEMHYIEHPIVKSNNRPNYPATQKEKRDLAIDIIGGSHAQAIGKDKEKFLVFCHDKNTGNQLVKDLYNAGIYAKFHNADVNKEDRLDIEKEFADKQSNLRVLISTSTLAYGRNLPARNVLIVGVHRGLQTVDPLDIIQMAGRAGRYGIDDAGTVYLICPEKTTTEWTVKFENPRPIASGFKKRNATTYQSEDLDLNVAAFHLLAEIESGNVTKPPDIEEWFGRSFAYHEDPVCLTGAKITRLLSDLLNMSMISYNPRQESPDLEITGLGKVSAWLYFSPYDIFKWYKNFERLKDINGYSDDKLLSWALTDIPSNDLGYIPKDLSNISAEWTNELSRKGVYPSSALPSAIAAWRLITGTEPNETALLANKIRFDIGRISQALTLIDLQHARWGKKQIWTSLTARITYGIPYEMVDLVRVPGIGGVRAKKLYAMGIHSLYDLALDKNFQAVATISTPTTARKWMDSARRIMD